ncbi:hypothetical protein BDV95DRAFT_161491 [Massariosphaeria phaeospora]|uniref:Uncharacterized protein n=1 Tax=Massariosphaeria phaeospora TaxID=100035 RepID=A0A7C8IA93_9PLEO|nr:hypothetical protein BDV95DRAFT_161491 [Massariosphaeria phaeospora]
MLCVSRKTYRRALEDFAPPPLPVCRYCVPHYTVQKPATDWTLPRTTLSTVIAAPRSMQIRECGEWASRVAAPSGCLLVFVYPSYSVPAQWPIAARMQARSSNTVCEPQSEGCGRNDVGRYRHRTVKAERGRHRAGRWCGRTRDEGIAICQLFSAVGSTRPGSP